MIFSVAVAGYELTVAGVMLQLPAPYVEGQLSVTVPAKSSCDVIEIAPVVPLLPTFTFGNESGPLRMKSGFEVTNTLKLVLRVDGASAVFASRLTVYVPIAVSIGISTVAVIGIVALDVGYTVFPGFKVHMLLGMSDVHDTFTAWLNDPAAEILNVTGAEVVPREAVTLEGEAEVIP